MSLHAQLQNATRAVLVFDAESAASELKNPAQLVISARRDIAELFPAELSARIITLATPLNFSFDDLYQRYYADMSDAFATTSNWYDLVVLGYGLRHLTHWYYLSDILFEAALLNGIQTIYVCATNPLVLAAVARSNQLLSGES